MSDQKLLRLEKRHKGLARVTAAINEIGRAHVRTPVTEKSRMPSSA